jgi:hypothetical protein
MQCSKSAMQHEKQQVLKAPDHASTQRMQASSKQQAGCTTVLLTIKCLAWLYQSTDVHTRHVCTAASSAWHSDTEKFQS